MRLGTLTLITQAASALMILLLFVGCDPTGHAEMVKRDQQGGILALRGHQDLARADAEKQMREHCAGDYEITLEEQAVIGEHTTTVDNESIERTTKSGVEESLTTDVTEFRITYLCAAAKEASDAMSKEIPAESGPTEATEEKTPEAPPEGDAKPKGDETKPEPTP